MASVDTGRKSSPIPYARRSRRPGRVSKAMKRRRHGGLSCVAPLKQTAGAFCFITRPSGLNWEFCLGQVDSWRGRTRTLVEVSKSMKQLPGRPSSTRRIPLKSALERRISHEDSGRGGRSAGRAPLCTRKGRFNFFKGKIARKMAEISCLARRDRFLARKDPSRAHLGSTCRNLHPGAPVHSFA